METTFQTSFIPKRPMPAAGPSLGGSLGTPSAPRRRGSGGWFMTLSVLLFIASLLSVGGAYLWKQYLLKDTENSKNELVLREKQFNVALISKLRASSLKLGFGREILSNHLAASKIFSIVSAMTAENVRFTTMELARPSGEGDFTLSLTGYGINFSTVAFQSDVLNQLERYGLSSIVKNPIVSTPSLNQNGTVNFSLTASIDPAGLANKKQ